MVAAVLITLGVVMTPIIIGGLVIIQMGWKDKKRKRQEEREQKQKKYEIAQENIRKENFYRTVYSGTWKHYNQPMEIRNIPRLSFEQWLNFYNSAPEHWRINLEEYELPYHYNYGKACIFPNYIKGKIDINIVWETPDDLHKFIMWQKNEYKNGDAAIFEEERARQMAKLTKALRDDIKTRSERAQKDLAELEKQIVDNMPKPKEETKKWATLNDALQDLCQKYSDYTYAQQNNMMASDGTLLAEIQFVHKYKPGNIIQVMLEYDKEKVEWKESTTMR